MRISANLDMDVVAVRRVCVGSLVAIVADSAIVNQTHENQEENVLRIVRDTFVRDSDPFGTKF